MMAIEICHRKDSTICTQSSCDAQHTWHTLRLARFASIADAKNSPNQYGSSVRTYQRRKLSIGVAALLLSELALATRVLGSGSEYDGKPRSLRCFEAGTK